MEKHPIKKKAWYLQPGSFFKAVQASCVLYAFPKVAWEANHVMSPMRAGDHRTGDGAGTVEFD